jgi:phage N-6-adenine-methyltransferase
MKTNKGLFTSKTDLWETPQDLFNYLDGFYKFTLDVCAIPENAKCKNYFTPEQDGLNMKWFGICFMNPPYGSQISKWVKKAYEEAQNGIKIVALLPARTDTKWFHDYIYCQHNIKIKFIKGRLKFGDSKNSAPFPSMLVIFNYEN